MLQRGAQIREKKKKKKKGPHILPSALSHLLPDLQWESISSHTVYQYRLNRANVTETDTKYKLVTGNGEKHVVIQSRNLAQASWGLHDAFNTGPSLQLFSPPASSSSSTNMPETDLLLYLNPSTSYQNLLPAQQSCQNSVCLSLKKTLLQTNLSQSLHSLQFTYLSRVS